MTCCSSCGHSSIDQCGISCCPSLKVDTICDCLDFDYRLIHTTTVDSGDQRRTIPVEVKIRLRIELCYESLVLGDLVYSTTLLPGEKVRLFSTDRRNRFTFDSATQLSYRNEQVSEEHFYLSSMSDFLSDVTVRDTSRSSNTAKGSSQTHVKTSDFLADIFCSPSIDVSGSYDAYSTHEFLRELSQHIRASDRRAETASRGASAISIGEVHTRNHAQGESEDHFESSSREFSNLNTCHAVTYFFYRVNKRHTLKVSLVSIKCRVIDPAVDTKVTNHPFGSDPGSTVSQSSLKGPAGGSAGPIPPEVREQAQRQVEQDLVNAGLFAKTEGMVSSQIQDEFCFERHFSLPTPGIIIKGCLDDCNVCEPRLQREMEFALEHKYLEDQRVKQQKEIGEKAGECCSYSDRDSFCCQNRGLSYHHEKDHNGRRPLKSGYE